MAIIKKEKINDCRKAVLTELKIKSFRSNLKRIKKPIIAIEPLKARNKIR